MDPVHLFLSMSLETVFPRKPLPIAVSAVANMNIDVGKLVACTEATAHCLLGSAECWIFPPKTWEHVLFVYIMFSVFVDKLIDRNKVFKL